MMNMKKYIFIAAVAMMSLASCNKDIEDTINDGELTTFNISIEKTKAELGTVDGSTVPLNWKDGDEIAFKLSDDSVVKGTVSVSGTTATVSVNLGSNTVSDAWFPYNSGTKPSKILQYQSASTISVPLQMASLDVNTISFEEIVEWSIVKVQLVKGLYGDAKKLSYVKVKNNLTTDPNMIQISTNATLGTDTTSLYFVMPVADGNKIEIIVGDSDGKEYRRKMSSTKDFATHKVYAMPAINDIGSLGKHIWVLKGEEGPTGNLLADNAPFSYPFRSQSDYFSTMNRGTDYWTQTAWEQDAESFKYRFGLAFSFNISGKGQSCSTWGSVSESKATINGTDNQVMRFPVHVGNYPIFAVKMSQLSTLGNSRAFKLDVNSTTDTSAEGTNSFYGRYMPVKYSGSSTAKTTLSEDGTVGIYYFDLSSNVKFNNADTNSSELLPNTRALHFTTWQIQIPDVTYDATQDPLPTCNFYWAGFFNSVDELTTFAANN